jgi:hypothetical protein
VLPEFGACAGGAEGTGRLLGPKISLRVAGTGEISPVDGVAEKSEFCAKVCPLAADGMNAKATSKDAGHSRPRKAAVAGVLFMTWLFSAEIEAISSRAPTRL